MNKQSEAKAKQNYQSKPLSRRCRECKHLIVEEVSNPRGWKDEKLSCGIGKFRVTPNGLCYLFEVKQ